MGVRIEIGVREREWECERVRIGVGVRKSQSDCVSQGVGVVAGGE